MSSYLRCSEKGFIARISMTTGSLLTDGHSRTSATELLGSSPMTFVHTVEELRKRFAQCRDGRRSSQCAAVGESFGGIWTAAYPCQAVGAMIGRRSQVLQRQALPINHVRAAARIKFRDSSKPCVTVVARRRGPSRLTHLRSSAGDRHIAESVAPEPSRTCCISGARCSGSITADR